MKTKELVVIALFSSLIAICSFINIPSAVPFTLQTFGVFLTLLFLGGKKGTLAILVYIFMGFIGIPVFSGFRGGVSVLFGLTGGYILGFILQGIVYIWIKNKFTALIVGLFSCYIFGTIWFLWIYHQTNGVISMVSALSITVFPFIIPDFLKMLLAYQISKKLKKHTKNLS